MAVEGFDFEEKVKLVDSSNMIKLIRGFPEQVITAWRLGEGLVVKHCEKIVFCGMGGSGISGDILTMLVDKPSASVHDYDLPRWVDSNTCVVVSSYSGNTEEAISCFKQAVRQDCELVVVTSNGRLEKLAKTYRKLLVTIPKGFQPRSAIAFLMLPVLRILYNSGLVDKELSFKKALKILKSVEGKALTIMSRFDVDALPIIYGTGFLKPIAYRWRTQFNENAKVLAISHALPECNHNELEALQSLNIKKHLFLLSSKLDSVRVKKRLTLTKKYARKAGITITHLEFPRDVLASILPAIHLGDFITYYHAVRLGVNPSPVQVIESFKKDMGFSL